MEPICKHCILYSHKKRYCALDGKQHSGCYNNFRPDPNKEQNNGD